jgi:hypothetical protein
MNFNMLQSESWWNQIGPYHAFSFPKNEGVEIRDHHACTILPPPPRPWDFSQWHHWILIYQQLSFE